MLRRVLRKILGRSTTPAPPKPAAPSRPPVPPPEEAEEPEVEIEAEGVAALRDAGRPLVFLDIREPGEIRHGHIAGATLIPMNEVPDRLAELPQDRVLIVYCAAGARSFGVAHYLREQGFPEAWSLVGGIGAWTTVDRAAWLPPPAGARFPPTTPVRLTEAAAARLGRAGAMAARSGTVQEVRATADGALRYTLGIQGERIGDLEESELEGIGRTPR